MKIAIVHDWLVTYAGAERVLEQMLNCFPEADLYAVIDFLPKTQRHFLKNKSVKTTFIQKLPFAKKRYRVYLPLMPMAIEQFDLSAYDLIISSSHAVAKGVLTSPDQCHISYIYSPMRYAWELQHDYLDSPNIKNGLKSMVVRYFLHRLRQWDVLSASRVDFFLADSKFIARRIEKTYRRQAKVIYPPVDIEAFSVNKQPREGFYLTASRLVPYKKVKLIVEAFKSMPEKQLVVIGEGPDYPAIKKLAAKNVQVLGYQPFEVLRDYLSRARAFVYAAIEDFGIIPVEAQACGTPVIAYAKGSVLETIVGLDHKHPTGLFFYEQTVDALCGAIAAFEQRHSCFDPMVCRDNAVRFNRAIFCDHFKGAVLEMYQQYFSETQKKVEILA